MCSVSINNCIAYVITLHEKDRARRKVFMNSLVFRHNRQCTFFSYASFMFEKTHIIFYFFLRLKLISLSIRRREKGEHDAIVKISNFISRSDISKLGVRLEMTFTTVYTVYFEQFSF